MRLLRVFNIEPPFARRAQTLRGHAEQETVRERGAPNLREARPDRGVHGAARPERPEQGLRLCDVRHQAGGHLCH